MIALQYEMRRRVGYAAVTARRAEAAVLAGERHDAFGGAGIAAHPHEAMGQDPAREKGPQLDVRTGGVLVLDRHLSRMQGDAGDCQAA
jgi:hypothetical protein